jgi:acyl-CoA reductase-like NAD-dependent aldehyde dehydrogenase
MAVTTVKLLINGEWVESSANQWHEVINPATQEVLARVPFATHDELNAAVAAAKLHSNLAPDAHRRPCTDFSQAAATDPRKHGGSGRHPHQRAGQNLG